MLAKTLITSRDPKGIHAVSIFEAAYNQSGLTDDRAQRLNENGGEFKKRMMALIRELSATDLYKHLWVPSTWTYPPEYNGPKDFHQQCEILMGILPGLDPEPSWKWYNDVYAKTEVPEWVEGVFAVPSEFALQRLFYSEIADRASAYCASINLLMGKIIASRKFYNYLDGRIDPRHLWRSDRTIEMIDVLWELQGRPDIIVLPAQLGFWHRGQAPLCAREMFAYDEFGAGSLEGAAIMLTHPEKEVRWEQLHMDLPGDYFSSGADGRADGAPCLLFRGEVRFGANRVDSPDGRYGSVSCWLPPQ